MSKQRGFNLIYFSIYNKYRNTIEYLYMSEAPETVIKEDTNKNIIQEATQEATPEINRSTTQKRLSKTKSNKKRTQMKNSLKSKRIG